METEISKTLGWLSLVLFTLEVTVASYLLMYAGYKAGYMEHILEADIPAIHEFLIKFVVPIGIFADIAAIGALIGALGLLIPTSRK